MVTRSDRQNYSRLEAKRQSLITSARCKMLGRMREAYRWCCGCCIEAAETDTSTSAVQQIITSQPAQSPAVKCPPERRSSIPLHRKRLEASLEVHNNQEGRGAARRPTTSDIDEELDDDDDDERCGGGIQFSCDVSDVFHESSPAQRDPTNQPTIINSFYDFVSR